MSEETSKAIPKNGTIGEFTNAQGEVCQCVVRGTDVPPWDNLCLVIDYVHPLGHVTKGAMIPVAMFRENETYQPNANAEPLIPICQECGVQVDDNESYCYDCIQREKDNL
jgi:predicted amidophosphoribosyltransferase